MSNEDFKQTIIVRRRRASAEEEHHGGVWKLAFADFMTAMMAFFLVMWLINSTTKETKATIVQYFNPVQLVDTNTERKGLEDPRTKNDPLKHGEKIDPTKAAEQKTLETEARLHVEPVATLEEIARSDSSTEPAAQAGALWPNDPFERTEQNSASVDSHPTREIGAPKPHAQADSQKVANLAPDKHKGDQVAQLVKALKIELEKAIDIEAMGRSGKLQADVNALDDGVLISLTDDTDFSMFEIGSIVPKPPLVRIIQRIGGILSKQQGEIEIAGHTDARSYKRKSYDNWRLSAERANVVNYMLLTGGLQQQRVARISGHADRRLKAPDDPLAAVNRRIEIFIRRPPS